MRWPVPHTAWTRLAVLGVAAAATAGIVVTTRAHHPARHPAVSRAATDRSAAPTVSTPGATASTASHTVPTAGHTVPTPDHVVIAVFENTAASSVLGNGAAPYVNQLANGGATFTASYAITHPSQPNYLDLFSGSNQGVTDDSCPHTFPAPNEGAQLIEAGRSFAGYSENLPAPGSTACTAPSRMPPTDSGYARKHNPWVNFRNVPASSNQPMTAFPTDYTRLPTVSWVVPNLCNDLHDCPVATGDSWLRKTLGGYASWASTHHSLLIVTFDEDDHSGANRIATIFFGQPVRPGRYGTRIDHFSVLRTIEDMYGLGHVGAAATARTITEAWR